MLKKVKKRNCSDNYRPVYDCSGKYCSVFEPAGFFVYCFFVYGDFLFFLSAQYFSYDLQKVQQNPVK